MKRTQRKSVLVTGATGFVGRRLVPRLEETGATVLPFSRSGGHDIADPRSFDPFRKERVDQVIHLAGSTYVPHSWDDPGSFYLTNTVGTQHVVDFCRATGADLVYVSTYVYGVQKTQPIPESLPAAPNNPYAHSKWLGEELCRFYAAHFGVKVTVLRPFNIFGPGQHPQFLIPTILRQARSGSVIAVKDLAPRRDYLHVDDLAQACIAALHHDSPFALFNVGSGASHSVLDLLEMVRRHAPHQVSWHSTGEERVNEIPDTVADIRAMRELGWSPRHSLEEFIKSELS